MRAFDSRLGKVDFDFSIISESRGLEKVPGFGEKRIQVVKWPKMG